MTSRSGPADAAARAGGSGSTRSSEPRRRNRRGSGEQLRAEIVTAARDLLAKAGNADAVSIRQVAEAVGVTSPSIYLHFADKDALLDAVVIDVFAELDAAMIAAAEGVEHPLDRLAAYGMAYIHFGVDHPEHYRIATMDPCHQPDSGVDAALQTSAFDHLRSAVVDCMRAGIFRDGDPVPVTLDLWAAAHGIASLLITKPYLPWGDLETVATRALCVAAMGQSVWGLFDNAEPETPVYESWLARQWREMR